TLVLTTHLLEEAEHADRIAIMHEGRLAALDTPAALQASIGGDSVTIRTEDSAALGIAIERELGLSSVSLGTDILRLELPDGHLWIAKLVETFPREIQSITLGKPTLEDVFIHKTGHQFWSEGTVD